MVPFFVPSSWLLLVPFVTEKDFKLETLVQSYTRTPGWGEDHAFLLGEVSGTAGEREDDGMVRLLVEKVET